MHKCLSRHLHISLILLYSLGDPSARYLQKRSESSSPPSNSIQDNLKRTPSKPVSRVLTDNVRPLSLGINSAYLYDEKEKEDESASHLIDTSFTFAPSFLDIA